MALKDTLKLLRERAGFESGKKLADALGIDYHRYMMYERGAWPNEETLKRIAATLHVTVDELIGYEVGTYEHMLGKIAAFGFDVAENDDGSLTILHEEGGRLDSLCTYRNKDDFLLDLERAFWKYETTTRSQVTTFLDMWFHISIEDMDTLIKHVPPRKTKKEDTTEK